MTTKKIAFVISGLGGGGAENVCVNLANGLSERGYKIDLVVLNLKNAVRDKELSSKVNLINLNVEHSRFSAQELWSYLNLNKPITVLSFNHQISVVLILLRKFSRVKFRLVSRNITYLSAAEEGKKDLWHGIIAKYLVKKIYPLSDLLIAQSQTMKDDLISYLNIQRNAVKVIYNPICQKIINHSSLNKTETTLKGDYLLCVGRLESVKAFHYAIAAFALVAADYPAMRLKIIGKGSLKRDLEEQAYALGVSDRIDFEGFKNNITPYYLKAKATLLTSLYEGFPNVLVESIALGTPILAFDCKSGPSEIIVDGLNGFLVRFQDVDHLAQCIRQVLSSSLNIEDILNSARKFNRDDILSSYERCLCE